jgi:hypothetical protein
MTTTKTTKKNSYQWILWTILFLFFVSVFAIQNDIRLLNQNLKQTTLEIESPLNNHYQLLIGAKNNIKLNQALFLKLNSSKAILNKSFENLKKPKELSTSTAITETQTFLANYFDLIKTAQTNKPTQKNQDLKYLVSESLPKSEKTILIAITRYNEQAKLYNNTISKFPHKFIAKTFKAKKQLKLNINNSLITKQNTTFLITKGV